MANARAPNFGRAGDRNLIALLGLKLLLLAFFIVLTSISQRGTERTEAVLQSVNDSFEGALRASHSRAGPEAGIGLLEGARPLLQQIGRLFDSRLPVLEMDRSDGTLTLLVDLTKHGLPVSSSSEIPPPLRTALVRTAQLLNTPRDNDLSYQVEVVIGTAAFDESSESVPGIVLASRLTESLVLAGVPADRAMAGVGPVGAERAVLIVRFYRNLPAAIDFEPTEAEILE